MKHLRLCIKPDVVYHVSSSSFRSFFLHMHEVLFLREFRSDHPDNRRVHLIAIRPNCLSIYAIHCSFDVTRVICGDNRKKTSIECRAGFRHKLSKVIFFFLQPRNRIY